MSEPRQPAHHRIVLGPPGSGWLDAATFPSWCAEHRGAACTIWFAAGLDRPLMADAAAEFSDPKVLAAWARRVSSEYDEAADAAPRPAAVAPWRSGAGRAVRSGVCVLDTSVDIAACRAAAAQHKVRVLGAHPLWAGAFAALQADRRGGSGLAAEGTLLVADGVRVSVLRWRGGALREVQQRWLARPHVDELDALANELGGEGGSATAPWALGHGLAGEPGPRLRVLGRLGQDGTDFAALLPVRLAAPDYFRSPMPTLRPWAQRALAATALVVLALVAHDAWLAGDLARADEMSAEGAAGDSVAAGVERTGAAATTTLGRTDRGSADATAAARARLQHPWPQLFSALEGNPFIDEWLVLEHRVSQPGFRLGGLASSSARAMQAARALAAADGVADALVSRAEPAAGGALAFEISGRLVLPAATVAESR